MTQRSRGEVEDWQADEGRVQIHITEIKSLTAQNTIIHKWKMAPVKGTWIWADLDFVLTTLHFLCSFFSTGKNACPSSPWKPTKRQWSKAPRHEKYSAPLKIVLSGIGIERVFLPVLTSINQPAMAQHSNNSTLSKQTYVTLHLLNTWNFSLKVTPQETMKTWLHRFLSTLFLRVFFFFFTLIFDMLAVFETQKFRQWGSDQCFHWRHEWGHL